jgi:tRNA (guanine-N7-)-methyltransferase
MEPSRNYIGIDVKAARMWKGAGQALSDDLRNIAFLRIQIDFLENYFEEGEVDEIWIVFPDPQPQQPRERQRLTNAKFLKIYNNICKDGSPIHLKTDSAFLANYTLNSLAELNQGVEDIQYDIYGQERISAELAIRTYYEKLWLSAGKKIHYLKFSSKAVKSPSAEDARLAV